MYGCAKPSVNIKYYKSTLAAKILNPLNNNMCLFKKKPPIDGSKLN